MHIITRKRIPGELEFGIIYGAIAALGLLASRVLPLSQLVPSCPFYSLTGLPCPACGGTRALGALSQGDVSAALSLNPLVTLAIAGALVLFIANLFVLAFGLPRPVLILTDREQRVLRFSAAAAVLAQWWYLGRTL